MSMIGLLFDEDWDDPQRTAPPPPAPQAAPAPAARRPGVTSGLHQAGQVAGSYGARLPASVPARPPSRGSGIARPSSRGPSAGNNGSQPGPGAGYGYGSYGQSRPAGLTTAAGNAAPLAPGYTNLGAQRRSSDAVPTMSGPRMPHAGAAGRRSPSPARGTSRVAPPSGYAPAPPSSTANRLGQPTRGGPQQHQRFPSSSTTSHLPASYAPLASTTSGYTSSVPATAATPSSPAMALSPTTPVSSIVHAVRQMVHDKPLHQILAHLRQITTSWTPSQVGELIARLTPSWSPEQTAYLFMGMIPGLQSTPRSSAYGGRPSTPSSSTSTQHRDDFCAAFSRSTSPIRLVHILTKVPDDLPLPSPSAETSPTGTPTIRSRRNSFGAAGGSGSGSSSKRSSFDGGLAAGATGTGTTRKQVLGVPERMTMLQVSEAATGQHPVTMPPSQGYASYH